VLLAGIANPRSFASTLSNLGATIVDERCFPDHHRYTTRDITRLVAESRSERVDAFVTTEKDAVKLAAIPEAAGLPILVVCIAIAFESDGSVILQQMLESTLRRGATNP
jgi:tetraacyldisaccharide 4'-kinase